MASADSSENSFLRELKRRNVLRSCLYYVIVCWIILKAGDYVFASMGPAGEQASRLLLIAVLIGFPIFFWIVWRFPRSPKGMVRTTSFVERRVLSNMVPINDRRHARASDEAASDGETADYRWVVTAETGPLTGLSYGVGRSVEMGSSIDCDIAVVNPNVSQRHVRLWLEGGSLFAEDLDSAKGTVINGRKIQGRHALSDEDELRLHDVVFRVSDNKSAPPENRGTMHETVIDDIGEAANSEEEPDK